MTMDIILEITELIDKIFNTDIMELLSEVESAAQLVPWIAEIIIIISNIPIGTLWIIAIILIAIAIMIFTFIIIYAINYNK